MLKNTFVQALNAASVPSPLVARTANGMRARATTSNPALDLFGSIGAMRGKDVIPAFQAAFDFNQDLALRIAQWARDVRGGSGERELYRNILRHLEATQPDLLLQSRLLDNIPELGRFDDLFIFRTGAVRERALNVFIRALRSGNGLAAKWAPRKGHLAHEMRTRMGLSPKAYRKFIVGMTNVVEQDMCARNWNEINFSHVPSLAMSKYLTAFHRNAPEAFAAYKEALKRNDGTAKVNAGAVYPYNVTRMIGACTDLSHYSRPVYPWGRQNVVERFNPYQFDQVAQSMWDALPNYMNGKNAIAVVDNSGSMTSTISGTSVSCMDVAVSLGIYCAQKSTGAFKDLSITFSDQAAFVQQSGNLNERMFQVTSQQWGSTNLYSVFDLILNHAVRSRVPASDMPEMVLILSDMQFNACLRHDDSALQMIRRKYENAGYEMPQVVFWNLNDYGNKPVKFNDNGVALISGFSPSLMESVLAVDMDKFTPEAVMLKAVGKDRYSW